MRALCTTTRERPHKTTKTQHNQKRKTAAQARYKVTPSFLTPSMLVMMTVR